MFFDNAGVKGIQIRFGAKDPQKRSACFSLLPGKGVALLSGTLAMLITRVSGGWRTLSALRLSGWPTLCGFGKGWALCFALPL